MDIIMLIGMNALIIAIMINEYKIKSLSLLFWGATFLSFALPHSVDVILKLSFYPEDVLNNVTIYVLLFCLIFVVFRYIITYRTYENIIEDKEEESTNRREMRFFYYLFLVMCLSALLWIVGIVSVSGNILSSTWSERREINNVYALIARYLFIASGSTVLIFNIQKREALLKIISVILFLAVILITRARIFLVPVIIPIIVYNLFYINNLKSIFKLLLVGVVFTILVFGLQEFRYLGTIDNALKSDKKTLIISSVERITEGEGEFSLRNGLYQFVYNKNEYNGFNEGNTYIRLALMPIPKRVLKAKPRDFAIDMWDAIYPMRTGIGGTYHPTFWGDLYGNFAGYGIIFSVFWVLIFNVFDTISRKSSYSVRLALIAPYSTMYFFLARGAVYNAIVIGYYSTIIIYMIIVVSKITFKRKDHGIISY